MTNVCHAAKRVLGSSALLLAFIAAPGLLRAQTTLFGTPSNFDVYNDTGEITHGFEIELDGLQASDIGGGYGFRYGDYTIVPIAGGVVLHFASPYVNGAYTVSTVIPAVFAPTGGHSCVAGIVGCDHFGYYLPFNGIQPTNSIYRWLVDDPANPGNLIPASTNVQIPAVTVTVLPPAAPAQPPVVVFEIPVPRPPPIPRVVPQFGDAQWVKVLKNEVQRNVTAPELLEDNPVVPLDGNPGQVETPWKLLQFNPHSASSGVLHQQAQLGQGSKSVIRKYEFYKYSGAYDPTDHHAICGGDDLCTVPLDGQLGDFIGNQMAAGNVGVSSVTVTKSGAGTGSVTSTVGKLNCGSACSSPLAVGTVVTLTAKAASNSVLTAWTGDCAGAQATCTFTITAENNVTANFDLAPVAGGGGGGGGGGVGGGGGASSFKISISKNGSGTVTTNPATQSFASGTVVTLTATPGAGQPFVGWAGACAGTSPTCTLTMDANKSVTANFR
jgi:uncharacterized repeat protein (TIGR02543 family)